MYSVDLLMKHHSSRHSFIENSFADLRLCLLKAKSAIPPGPLPARKIIGYGLTGRRVGPYAPCGPEAVIQFKIPR